MAPQQQTKTSSIQLEEQSNRYERVSDDADEDDVLTCSSSSSTTYNKKKKVEKKKRLSATLKTFISVFLLPALSSCDSPYAACTKDVVGPTASFSML